MFYGRPPPLDQVEASGLRSPFLLIYGEKDGQFPIDQLRAFERALESKGALYKPLRLYEGQGHAFLRDIAAVQKEGSAAAEAWAECVGFLKTTLSA